MATNLENNAIIKFITEKGIFVLLGICLFLTFKTCSVEKELKRQRTESKKTLDSIRFTLSTLPDRDYVTKNSQELLYDFLVFEDDIDKKKITFSDIKLQLKGK
jgi:hypothetical protein